MNIINFFSSLTNVKQINDSDILKTFEKKIDLHYVFNNQEYSIRHGEINNYFKFFERIIGEYYMYGYFDNDNLVATGCGILRSINDEKIWYFCDLKVLLEHRKTYIPLKLITANLSLARYSIKGYGVNLNQNKNNNILNLAHYMSKFISDYLPIPMAKSAGNLNIYKIKSSIMHQMLPIIQFHKGAVLFISLSGIKDFIINDQPILIYHLILMKNINNCKDNLSLSIKELDPNAEYMFCFHEDDKIIIELDQIYKTEIKANIIECNMSNLKPEDWDFIQSSEI